MMTNNAETHCHLAEAFLIVTYDLEAVPALQETSGFT